MGITIKDVAKISGVGISTVSRVLNHSGPVSDETREKVLKAVRSTNYIPNNSARSLKTTNSKNIAVLVKIITNAFFHKLIRVIEHEVNLRGYSVILQDVSSAADEIDSAIELAQDRNLCGVIIIGGRFTYTKEKFEQLGIPCVLLTVSAGESIDKSLYSSVIVNDEEAGCQATKQLIDMGHQKIGFVFHGPSNAAPENPNDLRFFGYIRALQENGIPVDPSLYDFGNLGGGSGYSIGFNAMQKLYAAHRDVTAVFAFSDELAIGVAKGILSLGLKIPDDISVIGFDGTEIMEYFNPSLDTLYQPADQMALSAIESLFRMMQGGESSHLVYDAVLLKRGSCKARSHGI